MSEDKDKIEELGDQFEVIDDLGSDFEVIEEKPAAAAPEAAKEPKAGEPAAPAAAAPAAAAAPGGAPVPVRSTAAWTGMGLAVALAGLLGGWSGDAEASLALLRGLMIASVVAHLLTRGIAAVQPNNGAVKPVLPGLLALTGVLGFVLGTDGFASGPLFTALGGLLALAAPSMGKKKDAGLPEAAGRPLDPQFTQSFGAYLLAFTGMLMPWCSSGEAGVDSIFGVITMFFLLVTMWAAWVGAFKLWTFSVVTGKLGFFLFLAPMEVAILGGVGLIRVVAPDAFGVAQSAYPALEGAEDSFLQYGAGPLLTLVGGVFALVVLVKGAKAATELAKERKVAEAEARKAARSSRKK